MKTPQFSKLVFVIANFVGSLSFATILTVNNTTDVPSPGQYTTLLAAHDAASAGDTLYITGTTNSYGSLTLTKKLTLIGPGYNPNQKKNKLPAVLTSITFGNVFNSNASNSVVIGLEFKNFYNASITMSGIKIMRSKIVNQEYSGPINNFTNLEIENCLFDDAIGISSSCTNIVLRNNIFKTGTAFIGGGISTINTIIITNNLFLGTCGTASASINNAKNLVISNNIFYGPVPSLNVVDCIFSNNIYFNSNVTSIIGSNGNAGSGNLNVDPLFQTITGCDFSMLSNYRLRAGSPARNAGTDGTDIGPTGGSAPIYKYATGQLTGEPNVPQVREISIPNAAIPAGGNLNVTVKARKRN